MNALSVEGFGSIELLRAYQTLGISPGDLASVIEDEARRAIDEAGGDRHRAITLGFRRMRRNGLLTDADVKRLERLALIVFRVEAGKQPAEEGASEIDALFRESLDDEGASELGSAMVGVTYSARNSTVAPAMGLFGMLVGALLTGGSGGMLIGGLVGWGVGKVCGDEED
ncbi:MULTISPECIES: hypothetical protein [Microbacterium]|uniref:hypothetical protein n=1 Tax=Microbacterium TaxID=33882 RepID=UPI00217DDDCD|nr:MULTISPECIES: hypothetical protein [Microbacterium]UWF77256.1 hypothetical protein JSY13_10785 [Microbacterium neungamense]WCM55413.1 hypothetical protein JRG78_10780 [Microbacterium sp. EF45047]